MSNLSVGTDLVSVDRIRKILHSAHSRQFKTRVFSAAEQEYCESKAVPSIHYAGRFAGKEAVRKAWMSRNNTPPVPAFHRIEILADEGGAPRVSPLPGQPESGMTVISIAHTEEYAIATAIIYT
ncbi:MAG: holo-ACP synthase [Fidelibacterota bacterium]